MFKGFQDTSGSPQFRGFPNLNFQMNNEAYGFSGCRHWFHAAYGLNTQTDLAAVSSWKDRINNLEFSQGTAGNQPRLVVADANFNNRPSIDFFSTARNLISSVSLPINLSNTLAIVYRKQQNTGGTGATRVTPLLSEFNSGSHTASDNYVFAHYFASSTNFNAIGLGSPNSNINDSSVGNTNPHIVIISGTDIVSDGALATTTGTTYNNFSATLMGSRNVTNAQSICQIAELLIYFRTMTTTQMIQLSNNINSSNGYAIY